MEAASTNTRESAVNVARMVSAEPERYGHRRLVLLTSDYHALRSQKAFRKAGVEVLPRPIPDIRKRSGNWLQRSALFAELGQETAKCFYYRLRGWI